MVFQKQMNDVTDLGLTCSVCGTSITQLPFIPDPARVQTLKCSNCLKASRPSYGGGGGRGGFGGRGGGGGGARQMVDVSNMNIKCTSCGTQINQLPFMPKRTEGLYCMDCNRARSDR